MQKILDEINNLSCLLTFQKEAVCEAIRDFSGVEVERGNYKELVDFVLSRLLGKGLEGMTTMEIMEVENAIKDFCPRV